MIEIHGLPEEEFLEYYDQSIFLMNNPEECELTIDELGYDDDDIEAEANYNDICSNYWYQIMKQLRSEYREQTGKSLPWPLPYV